MEGVMGMVRDVRVGGRGGEGLESVRGMARKKEALSHIARILPPSLVVLSSGHTHTLTCKLPLASPLPPLAPFLPCY